MANTPDVNTAIRSHIAAMQSKFAELDMLDTEFADLDATMPEGEGIEQFNLLSEKREELETEIRKMREHVQLISEWEKFKGSGWSDDVQTELNALDQQFADIADGASASGGLGQPALPALPPAPDASMAPIAPELPAAPPTPDLTADATAVPPMDDASAIEPPPTEALDAPPAAPLEPPMASTKNAKINEKINYELQDKKGSTVTSHLKKGDTHMATEPTKTSLKEKLAEVKNKREAISKEAKTRVASAWTIAKTMLPTAPAPVQKAFAASLLSNTTKALKAALRQTAINAHYTKVAETFKQVHKVELNDLLEDPSVLTSAKKEVASEVKGDAKSAAAKVADDRKECGPITGEYDDGRHGSEPKEIDASKAAERPDAGEKPGQTQNLSDGKTEKAAGKVACSGKDCKGCKNPDCKGKKAGVKKAEFPPAEGGPVPTPPPAEGGEEAPLDAPPAEEAPLDAPSELPPAVPEDGEGEAAEILTDEKKEVLEEKIDEAQAAIKAIESEILEEGEEELDLAKLEGEEAGLEGEEGGLEEGLDLEAPAEEGEGEELDFGKVFDQGEMEEKAASLANEGEKEAGEEDDFFAPSAAESLEASMDDDGMASMHDMFSMQGADGDPLASLIAGLKTAEQVAGIDVLPSMTGELANHFEQDEATTDDRDTESDHSDTLWAETIKDITPEPQGAKRVPQDSTNKLEKPKAAVLKKINSATGSDTSKVASNKFDVGAALFGAFDE